MIPFEKNIKYVGFWFVRPAEEPRDGVFMDWFGGAWINPDGILEFHFRFHYYSEGDPAGGERSWHGMKSSEPLSEQGIESFIQKTHIMLNLIVLRNNSSMDFVKCDLCDVEEAVERLSKYEWFHQTSPGNDEWFIRTSPSNN